MKSINIGTGKELSICEVASLIRESIDRKSGVKNGAALAALLPEFRLREEHSLTEGMAEFVPVYKLLGKIPAIRNISNKIIVLERK